MRKLKKGANYKVVASGAHNIIMLDNDPIGSYVALSEDGEQHEIERFEVTQELAEALVGRSVLEAHDVIDRHRYRKAAPSDAENEKLLQTEFWLDVIGAVPGPQIIVRAASQYGDDESTLSGYAGLLDPKCCGYTFALAYLRNGKYTSRIIEPVVQAEQQEVTPEEG